MAKPRVTKALQKELPGPDWAQLLAKSSYGLTDGFRSNQAPSASEGASENPTKAANENQPLLIIIDQFEEIFPFRKQNPEEADLFVQQLLRAASEPGLPISILLTMRTDFLGHCALAK